ncbi:MAG: zinc ABC transporter substrate-binding protein [Anaerolineales bacterium]
MSKTRLKSVAAALLLLPIAACALGQGSPEPANLASISPVELSAGEKLRVVATTTLVGDVAAQIGGEDIELRVLLPVDADLHLLELTPQDLVAVSESHVVFLNGFGLEQHMDWMLTNIGGTAPLISVSDGIQPLVFGNQESEHQDVPQSGQIAADPHVWLDPNNVMIWADNLAQVMGALDPQRVEAYAARAQEYQAELVALDAWIQDQVASIPEENRVLVAGHHALGYFAARYGFEVLGSIVPSYSTAAEPSAKELATLEQAMMENQVQAVFVSITETPALAEQVAADTGAEMVTLYIGSLSGPEGPANSYLALMEYNVIVISNALR